MDAKELKEKLAAALQAARDICDEAEMANRGIQRRRPPEGAGYLKEASDLKAQINKASGDESCASDSLPELGRGTEIAQKSGEGNSPGCQSAWPKWRDDRRATFVNAPEFKEWLPDPQRANPTSPRG